MGFRASMRCKACLGRVTDADLAVGQVLTLGCPRAPGQGASHRGQEPDVSLPHCQRQGAPGFERGVADRIAAVF